MSFSKRAGSASDKGEQEALEESSGLVKGLLERVEEVNVELLGLIDILTNTVEDDHLEESLHNVGLARNKDPRRLVAGVGGPGIGLGHLNDILPVGDGREDLEGLGQRTGLVSREDLSNPELISS